MAEAAKIFSAAKHPKSFVSLDEADHFLSQARDAEFVAQTLASWADRYMDERPPAHEAETHPDQQSLKKGEVLITERDQKFKRGMYTQDHVLVADEPLSFGGTNLGPGPYDFLLMALGSCTSMTIRMYANRKKLALEDIKIRLNHERIHADDCADCDGLSGKVERITRDIELIGDLTDAQRKRLIEIADRCPVHLSLENDIAVRTRVV